MNTEDSIRVNCNCGSQIHTLQLDMFEDEGGQVTISISYYPTTLWAKIKQFYQWIIGNDSLVADVILNPKDMDQLIDFYVKKLNKLKS